MRRAAATDSNQEAIVQALRAVGASVQHLHRVGEGCPDLLVGFRRQSYLLEVKDGSKPPSARGLTEQQESWHRLWNGTPVSVVHTVEEALRAVRAIK